MKKLLVFDFDGTLVDTITDVAVCFNQALEQNGFPVHDVNSFGRFVGGDLETVVGRLLPENSRDEASINSVATLYRQIYLNSDKPNTKPYPGIIALLNSLKARGISCGISTNKSQQLTQALTDKLFGNGIFTAVIGYDTAHPSKPNAYSVNELMRLCKAEKESTLYIGDGRTDIETARSAGVECLMVSWGQGTEKEMHDPYPVGTVNCAEEITEYI